MLVEKKVNDLQVNDVLDSGTVIIEKPFDQVRTPKGKTNLVVRRKVDRKDEFVTWSKATVVKVVVEDTAA